MYVYMYTYVYVGIYIHIYNIYIYIYILSLAREPTLLSFWVWDRGMFSFVSNIQVAIFF